MNGRILALLRSGRTQRPLLRVLAATRSEVICCDNLDAARPVLAGSPFDLVVLDLDLDRAAVPAFIEEVAGRLSPLTRVVLLSDTLDNATLAGLLSSGRLNNLLANTDPPAFGEVLVTCEKILRDDIFGLEKYLGWGVEAESAVIRRSEDRQHLLDRLGGYLAQLRLPARTADVARQVADEFVMNAVYNAPVDEHGARPYATLPRTTPVILEPGQEALFRYACDGATLALSVRDPFGSLDLRVLRQNLARCLTGGAQQISTKQGGAGMGFFYIYSAVHHFVVNLAPGRATEVIGLFDVRRSYRDMASRPKSFNVFHGGMRRAAR